MLTLMQLMDPGETWEAWLASLDLQKPTPQLHVEPRTTNIRQTRQVSNSSLNLNYPPKDNI